MQKGQGRPERRRPPFAKIKENGCVEWIHSTTKGYGDISVNGKNHKAHRHIYQLVFGKVPSPLVLDHLCNNRSCINPWHLKPTTDKENILRGTGIAAMHARQTHCKHGHPLSGDNLRMSFLKRGIGRACKTCEKAKHKRYRLLA
jgi:hypothetical protein